MTSKRGIIHLGIILQGIKNNTFVMQIISNDNKELISSSAKQHAVLLRVHQFLVHKSCEIMYKLNGLSMLCCFVGSGSWSDSCIVCT